MAPFMLARESRIPSDVLAKSGLGGWPPDFTENFTAGCSLRILTTVDTPSGVIGKAIHAVVYPSLPGSSNSWSLQCTALNLRNEVAHTYASSICGLVYRGKGCDSP